MSTIRATPETILVYSLWPVATLCKDLPRRILESKHPKYFDLIHILVILACSHKFSILIALFNVIL